MKNCGMHMRRVAHFVLAQIGMLICCVLCSYSDMSDARCIGCEFPGDCDVCVLYALIERVETGSLSVELIPVHIRKSSPRIVPLLESAVLDQEISLSTRIRILGALGCFTVDHASEVEGGVSVKDRMHLLLGQVLDRPPVDETTLSQVAQFLQQAPNHDLFLKVFEQVRKGERRMSFSMLEASAAYSAELEDLLPITEYLVRTSSSSSDARYGDMLYHMIWNRGVDVCQALDEHSASFTQLFSAGTLGKLYTAIKDLEGMKALYGKLDSDDQKARVLAAVELAGIFPSTSKIRSDRRIGAQPVVIDLMFFIQDNFRERLVEIGALAEAKKRNKVGR